MIMNAKWVLGLAALILSGGMHAVASAQEVPPPGVSATLFENIKPTLLKPFPESVALGRVKITFEETKLDTVRTAIGIGEISHKGDASHTIHWLCYTLKTSDGSQRVWLSSSEMGGGEYIDDVDVRTLSPAEAVSPTCPALEGTKYPLVIDGGLGVGMTTRDMIKTLGEPSASQGEWAAYAYNGKATLHGESYDVTSRLHVHLRDGRIDGISAFKTTSN